MDELGDAASKAAFVLGHEHCDERFGEATQQLGSTKMAKDVIRAAATLNVEPRRLVVLEDEPTKCEDAPASACLIVPPLSKVQDADRAAIMSLTTGVVLDVVERVADGAAVVAALGAATAEPRQPELLQSYRTVRP